MPIKLSVYLKKNAGEATENRIRNLILDLDGVDTIITKFVDKDADPDFADFRDGEQGTAPASAFSMRPRGYEFVGRAVGGDEDGKVIHRAVWALKTDGGFVVRMYESETIASCVPMVFAPAAAPGLLSTFFMPCKGKDELRRALFVEPDTNV
jgi:hypothetical protein